MDDLQLIPLLRERGQRVTPQRLALNAVLRDLDRHVTAEELLGEVEQRVPGVSAPTVYATLDLFEQLGIVRKLNTGGGAVLYDPRTEEHQHLVCRSCGRVVDVDATVDPGPAMRAAKRGGARPERAELLLVGLCERCA